MDDRTPERTRDLRCRFELHLPEFGPLIWLTSEGNAQKALSRLENARRGVHAAEKRDIDELDLSRVALADST